MNNRIQWLPWKNIKYRSLSQDSRDGTTGTEY